MSRSGRIGVLVGLVLVAVLALYVYLEFDFVKIEDPPHWGAEAKQNRFLAAGQLLQRRGYQVEMLPNFNGVPPGPGLLFLADPASGLSEQDARELRDWASAGNNIFMSVAPPGPDRVPDPLLDPLGVQVKKPDADSAGPAAPVTGSPLPATRALHTPDGDLQTVFFASLEPPAGAPGAGLTDSDGLHVLSFPVGQGHITALSDTWLFSNSLIGQADNAALLLYLVQPQPAGSKVWLIFQGQYPSLGHMIWQHAWPLVLSAGLLLLAWLWWGGRRFGPLLPALVTPRRQLGEHLRACGRYLWHAGQQARLYKAMRSGLRHRMLRRHPQWRTLSNNELVTVLASHSGLDQASLRRALLDQPDHDLARFLSDVRVLNHLRKQL